MTTDHAVNFRGRTAVITGAASGIGLALAHQAVSEGMNVVLADISEAQLSAAAESLQARAAGGQVASLVTDVSDSGHVAALADFSYERFGSVHLLFNNAGIATQGDVWSYDPAQWRKVFSVNLDGVAHGVIAFVPRMLAAGESAHVVNTSSAVGLFPMGGTGLYSATKAGIIALSESLSHDLRARQAPIGVSVLCPSMVGTNVAVADTDGGSPSGGAMPADPAEIAASAFEGIRRGTFLIFSSARAVAAMDRRHAALRLGDVPSPPTPLDIAP